MIDMYLLSVILFFAVIGVLIYKDRKNIEFKYVIFIRRTKRFRDAIDRIAQTSPTFWKAISTLGVAICFIVMIYGMFSLLTLTGDILLRSITEPALQLILPSPTATGGAGPGFILIPFWFWILAIAIILVPHELSHGIIARAEKIRLKSVGLMLMAILPGAFVEPDEKQLAKAKTMTQLRVFAAGSSANFVVALLTILLISSLIWPYYVSPDIGITQVTEGSPADIAGLQEGMIVSHVNGNAINPTYFEYLEGEGYINDEVGDAGIGDSVVFTVEGEEKEITLAENPETGDTYMGIFYGPISKNNQAFFFQTLLPLLNMIWILSFAVGMVNILPLYPLDGGRMLKSLTDKYYKKRSSQIVRIVSLLMLLIIIFDFIGPSLLNF